MPYNIDLAALTPFERMILSMINGDITLQISPATLGLSHSAQPTSRQITLTLVDAKGNTLPVNCTFSAKASVSKSSASGTTVVVSSNITFVNGVATVSTTLGGTFAAADTDTITIATLSLAGTPYSIAGGTSVNTWV